MPHGPSHQITPAQFVAKWQRVDLPERAASQEHFIDLCRMLGQPTPAEHDATGAEYAFEKGVEVSGPAASRRQNPGTAVPGLETSRGFADVWWKNKFGWEYKRKGKYNTLDDAYRQLLQYREALESPPLLIVSDIARIEIHTNFTGTKKTVHTIALADLAEPKSLDLLRRVFTNPESFRPTLTAETITKEVAARLGEVAAGLNSRGHDPHDTAHFLMKCMFCLFAEDVQLLPTGLFKKLLEKFDRRPADLTKRLNDLFSAMRSGGAYGNDDIAHFNGGLFDDKPGLELTEGEISLLNLAATQDWGSVEPAVFGTLFERSLDPAKRSQIGAHYTSREAILLIVEPVIMDPLRREWANVQQKVNALVEKRRAAKSAKTKKRESEIVRDADKAIEKHFHDFLHRLASVRVLDPACGSGNFLYVAIQRLLDLEKEVITFAARPEIGLGLFPNVRPTQLRGIEINPYAAELAQVVIWIGYLQWMRDNGFQVPRNPILAPLNTIENRDAILKTGKNGEPLPHAAEWPEADFIIGNPPFLGASLLRTHLGHEYVECMFSAFQIPSTSDLCCYWFAKAHQLVCNHPTRCGLLATQGIRGQHNNFVLKQICSESTIFAAWSDLDWLLDGAAVHVSIVCFGTAMQGEEVRLDGHPVSAITPLLSSGVDLSIAAPLNENRDCASRGNEKGGPFDLDWTQAREMLASPNPTSSTNAEVVRPYANGQDITRRSRAKWLIDFGIDGAMDWASRFERPFGYVREHVKPLRDENRRDYVREYWWLHRGAWPVLRNGIRDLPKFLVIPHVAKHFLVTWHYAPSLPDHQLIALFFSDDYAFGVLHSAIHELWARGMGTQLREAESGNRYTPTTCFETFPLPWPPGKEKTSHPAYKAIAAAAKDLDTQRERWLNPPEWLDPIAKRIDAADDFADVPEAARPLIRHSAIMAAAAQDPKLKKRTLTNLYNERPTWLRLAHEKLDRAVLSAYAATDPDGEWPEDWAEVWTDTGAGQPLPDGHPLTAKRAEIEERVLANLLRLNLARSS